MTEQSFLLDDDTPESLPWQEAALCAQTDPEAFFPEKGGSTREAKRVCVTCDVRASAWSTPWCTTSGSASGAACPSASAAGSSGAPADAGPPAGRPRLLDRRPDRGSTDPAHAATTCRPGGLADDAATTSNAAQNRRLHFA